MKHNNLLGIDLETVPDQTPDAVLKFLKPFKAPSTLTKTKAVEDLGLTKEAAKAMSAADVIAQWSKEFGAGHALLEAEEQWKRTGLDSLYGELFSVALKVNDQDTVCFAREILSINPVTLSSEADLLNEVFDYLSKELSGPEPTVWIGHNISGFDIRFLWQRCVMLGIKPKIYLPIKAKPWDNDIFDTMIEWSGVSHSGPFARGLKAIAGQMLGMEFEVDGSMVWDMVKNDKRDEIIKYNIEDVDAAVGIYHKIKFIS